jgi:hypothetical protein
MFFFSETTVLPLSGLVGGNTPTFSGFRVIAIDMNLNWYGNILNNDDLVNADLTTRDGIFALIYVYGLDRIDGNHNTVGGLVTVGFQLESLLSGRARLPYPSPCSGVRAI